MTFLIIGKHCYDSVLYSLNETSSTCVYIDVALVYSSCFVRLMVTGHLLIGFVLSIRLFTEMVLSC